MVHLILTGTKIFCSPNQTLMTPIMSVHRLAGAPFWAFLSSNHDNHQGRYLPD